MRRCALECVILVHRFSLGYEYGLFINDFFPSSCCWTPITYSFFFIFYTNIIFSSFTLVYAVSASVNHCNNFESIKLHLP